MASPSRYSPDGIGRDTYIETNNGGLYSRHRPASAMSVGTFLSIRRPENNLCDVGTKRTNYNYNGTGRDSYIGVTNGGFYPAKPTAEYANNYPNSLRYY